MILAALAVAGALAWAALAAPSAQAAPRLRPGALVLGRAWQARLRAVGCASPVGGRAHRRSARARGQRAPCGVWRLLFVRPLPARLRRGEVLIAGSAHRFPDGLLARVATVRERHGTVAVTAKDTTPQAALAGDLSLGLPMAPRHVPRSGIRLRRGVWLVPAAAVPRKTRMMLSARMATAAPGGACTPEQFTSANGFYVEITNLNIPLPGGLAVNLQGWVYFTAHAHLTLYQQPDPSHPGIRAQFDEQNYVDFSLYATPTLLGPDDESVFHLDRSVPLAEVPIGEEDIQAGPVPIVVVDSVELVAGLEGDLIAGLGVDLQSGREGFGDTVLVHDDGSVTMTQTPGAVSACANLRANGASAGPTVGGKLLAYLSALGSFQLYGLVGVDAGPTLFLENWLTSTDRTDATCGWPTFEDDLFYGLEVSFDLELAGTHYTLGNLGLGLTHLGTWNIDPCASAAPPTSPPTSPPPAGPPPQPPPSGPPSCNGPYPSAAIGPGSPCGFSTLGFWGRGPCGLAGGEQWTYAYVQGQQPSSAYWSFVDPGAGYYKVYAYIPDCYSDAPHAHYVLQTAAGGAFDAYIDQESYTNSWAYLGEVYAGAHDTVLVTLRDDSNPPGTYYVGADAVELVPTASPCASGCPPPPPPTAPPPSPPGTGCAGYPAGVVGPGCAGFTTDGWWGQGGCGLTAHELWTYAYVPGQQHSYAHWTLSGLALNSWVKLYAYIPDCYSDAPNAHYTVTGGDGGTYDAYVNQQSYTNAYAFLGYAYTGPSGTVQVTLADDQEPSGTYYVGADGIEAVPSGPPCGGCS